MTRTPWEYRTEAPIGDDKGRIECTFVADVPGEITHEDCLTSTLESYAIQQAAELDGLNITPSEPFTVTYKFEEQVGEHHYSATFTFTIAADALPDGLRLYARDIWLPSFQHIQWHTYTRALDTLIRNITTQLNDPRQQLTSALERMGPREHFLQSAGMV